MVTSETRREAEILEIRARDFLVKSFETRKKVKTNHAETRLLIKNALTISRSCQNFPRPTFFEVPFATLSIILKFHKSLTLKKLLTLTIASLVFFSSQFLAFSLLTFFCSRRFFTFKSAHLEHARKTFCARLG